MKLSVNQRENSPTTSGFTLEFSNAIERGNSSRKTILLSWQPSCNVMYYGDKSIDKNVKYENDS